MSLMMCILVGIIVSVIVATILYVTKRRNKDRSLSFKWHIIIGALLGVVVGIVELFA